MLIKAKAVLKSNRSSRTFVSPKAFISGLKSPKFLTMFSSACTSTLNKKEAACSKVPLPVAAFLTGFSEDFGLMCLAAGARTETLFDDIGPVWVYRLVRG